ISSCDGSPPPIRIAWPDSVAAAASCNATGSAAILRAPLSVALITSATDASDWSRPPIRIAPPPTAAVAGSITDDGSVPAGVAVRTAFAGEAWDLADLRGGGVVGERLGPHAETQATGTIQGQ